MKSIAKPRAFGSKARKERDEDLLLFREMFKREKEKTISLLQPVSEEFEPSQGSYPLYKIPSQKKASGNDFLAVGKEKNDYDWLKTPPATPLFPSLEMEANDPNMIYHKELPILHPLKPSRFAGKSGAPKPEQQQQQGPNSPGSKSTTSSHSETSSQKSVSTPNARPTSSCRKATATKSVPNLTARKPNQSADALNTSDKRNNTTRQNSGTKPPSSRGVSPTVRSRIPATMPVFSDEITPKNLITSVASVTGRHLSATRGRPGTRNVGLIEPNAEAGMPKRQSCSPNVIRGRRPGCAEPNIAMGKAKTINVNAGNGTLVVGSRMVEKMMNARRSAAGGDQKNFDANNQNATSKGSGFGRLMSGTSLDMANKHMEISRNTSAVRSSINTGSSLNTQATQRHDVKNFRERGSVDNKLIDKKGESKIRC